MINIILRVETEDKSGAYPVTPLVQVAFEREWKIGLAKAFNQDQKMEHMYWLGWKAMHSSGEVVKPFDGWLNTVKSVEIVEEEAAPL